MGVTSSQSGQGSTIVGAIVAILIAGAVASLGYYQFEVGNKTTTTTTTISVTCPSAACVPVGITNNAATTPPGFAPDTVTVMIGKNNTVFWTNSDSSGTPHTVVPKSGPSGGWPSGSSVLNQGGTYQYTFTVAGTYNYICSLHPTVMSGTVIVLPPTGATSSTTT